MRRIQEEDLDLRAEDLIAMGGYDPHWPKEVCSGVLQRALEGFRHHLNGVRQLEEAFSTPNFWAPKGLFQDELDELSEAYSLISGACELAAERIQILLQESQKKKLYCQIFEEARRDAEEEQWGES